MELKQTFKNHIIASWYSWFALLLFALAWWRVNFDRDFLLIGGLFYLVFSILGFYLHIEYFFRNKGEKIEINHSYIIINKDGIEKKYNSDELVKIILYKSLNLDKWGG